MELIESEPKPEWRYSTREISLLLSEITRLGEFCCEQCQEVIQKRVTSLSYEYDFRTGRLDQWIGD